MKKLLLLIILLLLISCSPIKYYTTIHSVHWYKHHSTYWQWTPAGRPIDVSLKPYKSEHIIATKQIYCHLKSK